MGYELNLYKKRRCTLNPQKIRYADTRCVCLRCMNSTCQAQQRLVHLYRYSNTKTWETYAVEAKRRRRSGVPCQPGRKFSKTNREPPFRLHNIRFPWFGITVIFIKRCCACQAEPGANQHILCRRIFFWEIVKYITFFVYFSRLITHCITARSSRSIAMTFASRLRCVPTAVSCLLSPQSHLYRLNRRSKDASILPSCVIQ